MSYYFKNLRPGQESDSDEGDLGAVLARNFNKNQKVADESSDDELKTLSFGSLKKADEQLAEEESSESEPEKTTKNTRSRYQGNEEKSQPKSFKDESFDEDSEVDGDSEEGEFFEEDGNSNVRGRYNNSNKNKKKRKHAPIEESSKKRVSRIRKIPGLETSRPKSSLYQDIRFERSTGEVVDSSVIRRRYQFLDEYRQNEIDDLQLALRDRKLMTKITDYDKQEMEESLKSMKSKLQTVKNRDLETKIVKDYQDEMNKGNKTRYHLKESEKRKVIQKWKFDHMKGNQREKVMERKRKKRMGKEFKQFEFHKQR